MGFTDILIDFECNHSTSEVPWEVCHLYHLWIACVEILSSKMMTSNVFVVQREVSQVAPLRKQSTDKSIRDKDV